MKMHASLGLAALTAALIASSAAQAEITKLRVLLDQGFEIVGTDVIPLDVIQRSMNNTEWLDDYLMTLQRGNQIAFCHGTLESTTDAELFAEAFDCSYSLGTVSPGSGEGEGTGSPDKSKLRR